jgi:hypothetical protein
MLSHFRVGSINRPRDFPADLLNWFVPTRVSLVGGEWLSSLSDGFAGNVAENGAYLGVPALAILGLFAAARHRDEGGRFLLAGFGAAVFVALGTALHVAGEHIVVLPWAALARAPLFDNVLPVRLALFASLAASVMVASWAASFPRRGLAVCLTGLAVLAILPNLGAGLWKRTPVRPAFFTDGLYRACVRPGDNLLAIPYNQHGDSLLWQAESGFRFGLAEGYVRPGWPTAYDASPIRRTIGSRPTSSRRRRTSRRSSSWSRATSAGSPSSPGPTEARRAWEE